MNFSIITPTFNRSKLVEDLLSSLFAERNRYEYGNIEVLIIDSSNGIEKEKIYNSCIRFNALYLEGPDSVRKKRNIGITSAKYENIIFLDSDVFVVEGFLNEYYKTYKCNISNDKLGGILGYTEFIGEKSFWWKVLELTSLVDSFSFARKHPFHSWTIANNVSFKTDILKKNGMFEENFPFILGGDDLDMSYRVTKSGYMIASAPNAITYHYRCTWDSFKAIRDRAKRWGSMEILISKKHPELYMPIIPKSYVLILIVFLFSILTSLISGKWLVTFISCFWVILNSLSSYIFNGFNSGFKNPIYYFIARVCIQGMYEYYVVLQSLKNKSLGAFYKGLVFNSYQIKYGMKNESFRISVLFITYVIAFMIFIFIYADKI